MKVLPNSFNVNGHTIGFHPHIQILKYESHEIVIFYLFIYFCSQLTNQGLALGHALDEDLHQGTDVFTMLH